MKSQNNVQCHRCKHYHITWDKNFPHGCRAMKFKSRKPPYITVLKHSKMACLMFSEKEKQQIKKSSKTAKKLYF